MKIEFRKKVSQKKINLFKARTNHRNIEIDHNTKILKQWDLALNSTGADLKLIHAISPEGSVSSIGRDITSPFLSRPVETILSGWDVISTSCVPSADPTEHEPNSYGALDIYLDLRVPVQNILGTHTRDVCFDTFAGLENGLPGGRVIDKAALADTIRYGIEAPNPHNFEMDKPYNTLQSPDVFRRWSRSYNEVLVVGRPGLQMHFGFIATQCIRLKGITYLPEQLKYPLASEKMTRTEMDKFTSDIDFIKKIMKINNLKVINFPWRCYPFISKKYTDSLMQSQGMVSVGDAGIYRRL